MPLVWDKSLEIGIDKIDEQHKELIDAINAFLIAMRTGEDLRTLKNLLVDISSITSRHFGYEEACMHRYKCPVAAENKNLHEHFQKTLHAIRQELLSNGASPDLCSHIDRELLDWFGNHIRGIDTKLRNYV